MSIVTLTDPQVRVVAIAAAIGFGGIALFQLALAAGAPWGRVAWGGQHAGQLPTNLRIASAFAVVLWAFAATIVLRRGGAAVISWPAGLAHWGTWILVGLLALAVLMNAISPSGLERLLWVPYSLLLGVLCFLVAHN